jgi:hypothetical protein
MSYVFDVNNFPATGAETIYKFKTLLKTAGWVVKQSSDGTNLGSLAADTIINFSSGTGGLDNSNAWFRIQEPSGVREILIQRGSNGLNWKVRYSAASKFTSGVATASTPNTATDEQYLIGSSGSFSNWMSTDNTYYWSGCASTTAPYSFWSIGYKIQNAANITYSGIFILDPMMAGSYNASDTDPVVILAKTTSTGLLTASTLNSTTGFQGWMKKDLTGAAFVSIPALKFVLSSTTVFPSGAGNNPFTQNDITLPIPYGRTSVSTSPAGIKGISSILSWNCISKRAGELLTINTDLDRVAFEDINLPWNGNKIIL